jgi:hypothetical protein
MTFLNEKETHVAHLNLHDPDYISFHYLIAKDIVKELEQFRAEVIPNVTACVPVKFSELIDKFDKLKNSAQLKYDSLNSLKDRVYLLFYEKALIEYQQKNEAEGEYNLQRSLQYNTVFPNAILLKLNKLLNKNRFEDCLSLLNTLYYETAMDDEQEQKAIEFTDKFYNKLYNTGDSLVKKEHAAEALELFEILEVFCLNLPAAYCNDDYFHGVLRSKTGIYESYLAIAKAAEKRANITIADHFYQYAQDYLETNPYLKEYEPRPEPFVVESRKEKGEREKGEREKGEREKGEREKVVEIKVEEVLAVEVPVTETSVAENKTSIEEITLPETSVAETSDEIKLKYDQMVSQGLALCIREKFSESYKMFSDAKKLEECKCFDTDFRVDLMLYELSKFGIK